MTEIETFPWKLQRVTTKITKQGLHIFIYFPVLAPPPVLQQNGSIKQNGGVTVLQIEEDPQGEELYKNMPMAKPVRVGELASYVTKMDDTEGAFQAEFKVNYIIMPLYSF